ncbi:hypothetical protein [Streptomyces sp. NPDC050388]|uniref:hypothetical protein n=1 Tax=Streptomyces sp. NPDC050388 TaxID=3155781 RepID=UPI003438FE99
MEEGRLSRCPSVAPAARGESSADHLYIGEALGKWLRAQGRPNIVVDYVKQKSARSDTIKIRHSLGRERVPAPSIEMHWRMDVLRLHQLWRHR